MGDFSTDTFDSRMVKKNFGYSNILENSHNVCHDKPVIAITQSLHCCRAGILCRCALHCICRGFFGFLRASVGLEMPF